LKTHNLIIEIVLKRLGITREIEPEKRFAKTQKVNLRFKGGFAPWLPTTNIQAYPV
jgi:hypothetical protein